MAKLVITLETDQECFPESRLEMSREQFRIRDCLVILVGNVVNKGLAGGDITAISGVRATYTYVAKRQKTTAKPAA